MEKRKDSRIEHLLTILILERRMAPDAPGCLIWPNAGDVREGKCAQRFTAWLFPITDSTVTLYTPKLIHKESVRRLYTLHVLRVLTVTGRNKPNN